MIDTTPQEEALKRQHGPLWWFGYNILDNLIMKPARKHRRLAGFLAGCALIAAFIMRAYLHPVAYAIRIHSPDIIGIAALIVLLLWLKRMFRKKGIKRWKYWAMTLGVLLVVTSAINLGVTPHGYLSLYFKHRGFFGYGRLDVKELNDLPITGHERIQPLHSIRALANEAMTEVEHPSDPDFVRIGDRYRFTMAIEPTYNVPRLTGVIQEIFNLPGDVASPDFSRGSREKVEFAVGEHMFLGKNSATATIKSFSLFGKFWSYKPGDVKYMKDDKGEWVEVVSLTRLRGWIFPKPEFGGVQVIRQSHGGILHALGRLFFGEGEWIPPEEIAKHPYLKGQNLLPVEVSRYAAQSFRFQNGFWGPFPGYHRGDIRIPDLVGDSNNQPFTIYAEFGAKGSADNKLWHYFALEPYQLERQGLNTSVFVPADGIGPIKVYRHYKRDDALTGVSAIAAKVMESRKLYDWQQSHPAEQRPWIHYVGGKVRFFWLTTVVTYKNKGSHEGDDYIAGAVPEVVLTDALYKRPVWVHAANPAGWVKELESDPELSQMWGIAPPPQNASASAPPKSSP